jgi:uncharacterized membrane protein HdeD (DUF308 family)
MDETTKSSGLKLIDLQEFSLNWGWFMALGLILIALGVVALGRMLLVTLASVVFFGWLLVIAASALTLTLILAVFFMVSGAFRILVALLMRFPEWRWLLLNGLITLLLGLLIWKQWPLSGLWVIGLFIGFELIYTGVSWVLLSLAARRLASP